MPSEIMPGSKNLNTTVTLQKPRSTPKNSSSTTNSFKRKSVLQQSQILPTAPRPIPNSEKNVARKPVVPRPSSTMPRSTSQPRGMHNKFDGLSHDTLRPESFQQSINRRSRPSSSLNYSAPLRSTVNRTFSHAATFDHTKKSTDRINMSFDNVRYWEIEKTNRFLAERLQKVKPTYSRTPSEPNLIRSRFQLRQSKEFFDLERENSRLANRLVQIKRTVPPARPTTSSGLSRPGSVMSNVNSRIAMSRSASCASLQQRRPEWNNRW